MEGRQWRKESRAFCRLFFLVPVCIWDKANESSTHRELAEKTGIFTFIGIGRKEDPTKKDLSIQVYVTPELYLNPRY
jgi:hypothetical protein